ncbi:MAG TPA: peptidoglycan-binding domain-containing protein [Baekduia sp.]
MPRTRTAAVLLPAALIAAALLPAGGASAAVNPRAPKLAGARCVPPNAKACSAGVAVRIGRQIQLRGTRLKAGQRVTFRWSRGALATQLHRGNAGYVARVPPGTKPGTISVTVRDGAGRRSNVVRVKILAEPKPVIAPARTGGPLPGAFLGNGMWIWELPKSDGGDANAIAARAAAAHVSNVFVKAGDGTDAWPQFSPLLIGALHQHGLKVCAWQFVYGANPTTEAAVAASAIALGADCFVIDAESQYEGRYASAQTYMTTLRAKVGPDFPIGLTSFPYVDYHPNLPFSVFLGPGGAQVNLPQVYWKDIGSSVDAVSAHTLAHNRIYGQPIAPLGQAYSSPSAADLRRFRQIWAAYGSAGLSWWSWQSSSTATWNVLDEPAPAPAVLDDPGWPALGKGAKGDEVIWLQEHLSSSYPAVTATAKFDDATIAAVKALQTAGGLPVTGTTDTATWAAALALPLTPVDWTATAAKAARATAARHHRREIPRVDAP